MHVINAVRAVQYTGNYCDTCMLTFVVEKPLESLIQCCSVLAFVNDIDIIVI